MSYCIPTHSNLISRLDDLHLSYTQQKQKPTYGLPPTLRLLLMVPHEVFFENTVKVNDRQSTITYLLTIIKTIRGQDKDIKLQYIHFIRNLISYQPFFEWMKPTSDKFCMEHDWRYIDKKVNGFEFKSKEYHTYVLDFLKLYSLMKKLNIIEKSQLKIRIYKPMRALKFLVFDYLKLVEILRKHNLFRFIDMDVYQLNQGWFKLGGRILIEDMRVEDFKALSSPKFDCAFFGFTVTDKGYQEQRPQFHGKQYMNHRIALIRKYGKNKYIVKSTIHYIFEMFLFYSREVQVQRNIYEFFKLLKNEIGLIEIPNSMWNYIFKSLNLYVFHHIGDKNVLLCELDFLEEKLNRIIEPWVLLMKKLIAGNIIKVDREFLEKIDNDIVTNIMIAYMCAEKIQKKSLIYDVRESHQTFRLDDLPTMKKITFFKESEGYSNNYRLYLQHNREKYLKMLKGKILKYHTITSYWYIDIINQYMGYTNVINKLKKNKNFENELFVLYNHSIFPRLPKAPYDYEKLFERKPFINH